MTTACTNTNAHYTEYHETPFLVVLFPLRLFGFTSVCWKLITWPSHDTGDEGKSSRKTSTK